MSSNRWEIYKWGELCTLLYGKALKGYRESKGNIPVYGTNGRIGFTDKELSSRDGIIIGRKGAYRGVHYSKVPFYVIDTAFYLNIMDNEKLDMKFAYYNLLTKNINSMDSGSAIPSTSREDFYNMESAIPPLEEQKAIAHILSTLDEKIELNKKINKTLEDIAQAIFKHWFVDFEFPNENGESYKSSGGEMVESELGMIPKGWEIGTVSDMGEVVGGATPSKKKEDYFTQNGIPWITPKDLANTKDLFIERGSIDITEKGLKNSSVRKMPKGTVLFSSRAPIGYIAISKNEITTNQGFKSIVPAKKTGFSSMYVFCWLKENTDIIRNRANGSTFKEISGSEMKKISSIIPPKNILVMFNNIQHDLFKKIETTESENRILKNIRDTLLPKLMSGEIRVPLDQEGDCEEVS